MNHRKETPRQISTLLKNRFKLKRRMEVTAITTALTHFTMYYSDRVKENGTDEICVTNEKTQT
jgi:hypothetical protein